MEPAGAGIMSPGAGCAASHADTAPTSSGASFLLICAMQSGAGVLRAPFFQAPNCALR